MSDFTKHITLISLFQVSFILNNNPAEGTTTEIVPHIEIQESKRAAIPIEQRDHDKLKGVSERIQQNLFQSYSKADVPDLNKPTEIKIGIHINSFDAIRNSDMSYDVHMYLRLKWLDPRLRFDWMTIQSWNDSELLALSDSSVPETIYILPDYIKNNMFIPDVFFRWVLRDWGRI